MDATIKFNTYVKAVNSYWRELTEWKVYWVISYYDNWVNIINDNNILVYFNEDKFIKCNKDWKVNNLSEFKIWDNIVYQCEDKTYYYKVIWILQMVETMQYILSDWTYKFGCELRKPTKEELKIYY